MQTRISLSAKRVVARLILFILTASPGYAAVPPYSGAALDSVKPPAGQQPARPQPGITVESQIPAAAEGGDKIPVKAFLIGGEPPVPAAELLQLIESEAGKVLSLGELNGLAERLTRYLREKGYLVAFAYVPSQEVKGGIVGITVIPGKYGQVKVTGDGHLCKEHLTDMLFAAKSGGVITSRSLERALLLLSDLNGVSVKGTLTPGAAAGTADLILEVADTAKISGAAYIDNWGSRYTGRTRYGVQTTINNLSGNGDMVSVGGLTTGQGIHNYNLGYSTALGSDGAKAAVSYSRVNYMLGDAFAGLGAAGQAEVVNYTLSYPLLRGRSFSLCSSIGYDRKHLRDDIAGYGSYSPRDSSLWNLGLSGSFADTWLGGSSNAFTLMQYHGKLSLNDATALAADAATARTKGGFSKTLLTYQRQQYLTTNLTFNINFTGQLADKNLDSSEKLFLGGADGVRAYPQGEASGDQGYRLTGEFSWRLPGLSAAGSSLYFNSFYDYGSIMTNKNPYTAGAKRRSLTGAGIGLLWVRDRDFTVRMDYAWKAGGDQAGADRDNSGRFWLQGVKYF